MNDVLEEASVQCSGKECGRRTEKTAFMRDLTVWVVEMELAEFGSGGRNGDTSTSTSSSSSSKMSDLTQ